MPFQVSALPLLGKCTTSKFDRFYVKFVTKYDGHVVMVKCPLVISSYLIFDIAMAKSKWN